MISSYKVQYVLAQSCCNCITQGSLVWEWQLLSRIKQGLNQGIAQGDKRKKQTFVSAVTDASSSSRFMSSLRRNCLMKITFSTFWRRMNMPITYIQMIDCGQSILKIYFLPLHYDECVSLFYSVCMIYLPSLCSEGRWCIDQPTWMSLRAQQCIQMRWRSLTCHNLCISCETFTD